MMFYIALTLNIALQLLALAMLSSLGFVESLYHTCFAIAGFAALLFSRAYGYRVYAYHAAAMILIIISGSLLMRGFWPWWADLLLHFGGGLFVALYLLTWLDERLPGGWLTILWGVSIVALVGVSWELLEGLSALFSTRLEFVLVGTDILGDLLADLLGGLLGSVIFLLKRR